MIEKNSRKRKPKLTTGRIAPPPNPPLPPRWRVGPHTHTLTGSSVNTSSYEDELSRMTNDKVAIEFVMMLMRSKRFRDFLEIMFVDDPYLTDEDQKELKERIDLIMKRVDNGFD